LTTALNAAAPGSSSVAPSRAMAVAWNPSEAGTMPLIGYQRRQY